MQQVHLTVLGCVQFLCWLAAMTACIKGLIRNKELRGKPIRMGARASWRNLPLFQYMNLAWAGYCLCELVAPRDSFHLKLYGVLCFWFLGMTALSVYISGKPPRPPKWMRPDPDSMLHLDD